MTGPVRQQKGSIAAPRQENLLSPLTVCIIAVALITGVFAIYSPALSFQFILDDHHFINDPRLQSPGHVWEYFTNYVWAQVVGGPPGGVGLQEGNTGSTQSPDYGLRLLETARAQAQFDKAAATKSYQQLLDLWKNADADFIPLEQAKREVAGLAAPTK
jgi:hypothetical protein